jgi:hypothetical protein
MKIKLLVIVIALLSVTGLLFGIMYDLTYVDDQEFRTHSTNPKISSFEDNAYVVWGEAKDSEFFDVYFRKIVNGNLLDESINLTQGTAFYPRPQVLASENNVYVLWTDRDSVGGNTDHIYFKKSNDYGKTFGDDGVMIMDSSNGTVIYPYSPPDSPIQMAESNDILYVFVPTWNSQTKEYAVIFRASDDHGNTFDKPVSFFQFRDWAESLHVVSENDVIYAVSTESHDYSNESGIISFKKIFSDGKTSDVVNLNKTGFFVNSLDLSVSDDNVYVISVEIIDERQSDGIVHEKRTLFFTKSHDGGNTFDVPKKLSMDSESEGVESQGIQVSSYDDFVYVTWEEQYHDGYSSHRKTWFAKSNDKGNSFDIVLPHPLDELRSKYGHLNVHEENDTLYFVVTSAIDSFDEDVTVYFAKGDDNKDAISKVVKVTGAPLPIFRSQQVSIEENHVQIVAEGRHDKNCILYITSDDGGESFSDPANLSPNGDMKYCIVK